MALAPLVAGMTLVVVAGFALLLREAEREPELARLIASS
jgi:hypothetical protein